MVPYATVWIPVKSLPAVVIVDWSANSLILPEGFLWHVLHSMANALCYCCYGTNKPSAYKHGWDGIVHMDIKPENMLLATPDLDTHHLYPCVKLADFGKHPNNIVCHGFQQSRLGAYHRGECGGDSLL